MNAIAPPISAITIKIKERKRFIAQKYEKKRSKYRNWVVKVFEDRWKLKYNYFYVKVA
jgi:hypothetical protein